MIDFEAVEIELHHARQARIDAERASHDIEELAAEIRQSHQIFIRLMLTRRHISMH